LGKQLVAQGRGGKVVFTIVGTLEALVIPRRGTLPIVTSNLRRRMTKALGANGANTASR